MYWFSYAISSALVSTIKNITMKEGLFHTLESSFTFYYSLISLICSLLYNIVKKVPFYINKFAIIAGIFQGISTLLVMIAINKSNNPGLPMAFFRSQAILTAIVSVFLFKSTLPYYKLVAMGCVIYGLYKLANSLPKTEKYENKIIKTRENSVIPTSNWILISIVSGVFMTLKDIFLKYSLFKKNSNVFNFIFYSLLLQTIVLFIYDLYISKNIKLDNKDDNKVVKGIDIYYTIISGILLYIYVYVITMACKLAPNIGFVKSIDSLGIVLTIILSNLIFKTKLNTQSYIGIGISIAGIIFVSI